MMPLAPGGERSADASAPSRRQELPREFVADHQRRRVIAALAELAHEFGIGEVTVEGICRLARMGRKTFYDHFGTISGCRRLAFDEAFEVLFDPVKAAAEEDASWLDGLTAAIGAFLEAIVAEPLLAELCLVHSFGAAEEASGHDFEAGVEVMAGVLSGGRDARRRHSGPAHSDPPPGIEEYLARMIVSLGALRVRQEATAQLPEHRDELVRLVVTTLFGGQGPTERE